MPQPRFSLIIPTRNRPETLRYSLQTCLRQDYDDYEVVVSDNSSNDESRQVVEEAQASRIKYVRPPEPMSMSDHWDFALSQATGEFVIILGDDDGIMPYALRELDRLATQTQMKAICWSLGVYTWPGIALPEEANYLTFKLARTANVIDGKAAIAAFIRHQLPDYRFPMIYHAAVHQSIIDQIRQTAGRVFLSIAPDSTAGICIAYLAGRYLSVEAPLTIGGLGPKSTNIANMRVHRGQSLVKEYWNRDVPAGRALHPWVPDLPNGSVVIMESFLRAKEAIFPNDSSLNLDRKLLAQCALGSAHAEERNDAIQKIRASLADVPDILSWFDQIIPQVPAQPPWRYSYAPPYRGCDGDAVYLNADRFGIRDIAGAVAFCAEFLNYKGGLINYDLPARSVTNTALQQVQQQLAEAQNRIRELESRV